MFNVFHASIIFSIGWFIRNVMNFELSNTFAYFRILNVNAKVSNCFFLRELLFTVKYEF